MSEFLKLLDSQLLPAIIGGCFALTGVIIGALLNHFFQSNRIKHQVLLDKKIEIYSDILVKINTVFQDEVDDNLLNNPDFKNTINTKLAKTLSLGRLVANKELDSKLREYYDIASAWWRSDDSNDKKSLGKKMDALVIKIEQLMKEDLGSNRSISTRDIDAHCSK